MSSPSLLPPCSPYMYGWAREQLRATVSGEAFPTREQLWRGAVLETLMMVAYRDIGEALTWIGRTCYLQMGADVGAVTFAPGTIVGLFFLHEETRSPWSEDQVYDLRPLFHGIPPDLRAIADMETAAPLAIDVREGWGPVRLPVDTSDQPVRMDPEGARLPLVTAAVWGNDRSLTAAEPWAEVYEHGALLIHQWLLEPRARLADVYEHSTDLGDRIWGLYQRWLARTEPILHISRQEWQGLEYETRTGQAANLSDDWIRDQRHLRHPQEFEQARSALAAVGIELPAD